MPTLLTAVRCRLLTRVTLRQLPTSQSFSSHSLTGVPSPLPVTSRSRVQNHLSGFAPKQTKESSAWRTTYIVLHQFYFKQFSLAWIPSLIVKTFLFQAIQFIQTVLIQLIQFRMSRDFVYTQLNAKTVPYITIQFSVSTVSMSKIVPFQAIQFSISTQFKCKYSLIVKNIFISSYPFQSNSSNSNNSV